MKKILLVKKSYRFFPIGLAHVMTALRKNGIAYDFLDMDFQRFDWKQKMRQGRYGAVGIGGLYADFNYIVEFAKEVKQLSPRTPFVLGGNITSDISMDVLFSHIPLDYAVVGEGEETFPELLRTIDSQSGHVQNVEGIVYRGENGEPIATTRRKPLNLKNTDLYPTWDDLEIDDYLSAGYPGYEKFTAMPVLTGRGCTGRCVFCSPTNGRYRMRPIDQVIAELIRLNEKYTFTGYAFLNEIMYPTEKMMHEFLEAYKQTGISKPWIACLRVDIGINLLRAMKQAGCIGANCGIESGNDRVLKQMKKQITVEQVKAFYRNCRKVGLVAQGSIMFGNETEIQEELTQTIDLMIHEDIHSIGGALLISYPGTEVYKRALENGRIEDEYQYLKNLDFSDISFQGTFRNVHYLNVSNMSDDILFRTMAKQACRHRTYNYYKFSALDVDLIQRKGRCAVCGAVVDMHLDPDCMLTCVSHCEKCYSPVNFILYELEPFAPHTAMLKQRFARSRRIAVYGTGTNARYLHFHDVFWLDLDKLVCFVDETGDWKGDHFFNGKAVRIDELANQKPDLVLIADSISPAYARTNLRNAGIAENQMVSMLPSQWHDYLFGIYARQHQCA
jgi:radical SAM superfamily enzyme YgiQ (UPF0313 family)